jgi:threonylcarbamoyladenosine tRNA methylthiotransferase MtaB
MRAAFYTLGCKLNQCESEALASAFGSRGFSIVPPSDEADLYIVNTCTVTSKSEQKARRMIRRFSRENPAAAVIVTGCYAQMEPQAFENLGPHVRVVSGDEKARLLNLPLHLDPSCCGPALVQEGLKAVLSSGTPRSEERFSFDARSFSSHSRAFLKIQDGCDNHCTYCRVTLARGPSVSLEAEELVDRAQRLESEGFDEIILTGINLSLYRSGTSGLAELADRLTAATSRVRFRLSSLEPDYLTPERVALLAHPRICPHFHLPVQAGDSGILRRMGRSYRSQQVLEGVRLLREARQDPFIAADIIVGFPGEDEAAFEETVNLVTAIRPAGLHIFPYSLRPGTAAADFTPQVPQRTSGERAGRLRVLAENFRLDYIRQWAGRDEELLIEEPPVSGCGGYGLTGNYLQAELVAPPEASIQRGRRYPVRLAASAGGLEARLLSH